MIKRQIKWFLMVIAFGITFILFISYCLAYNIKETSGLIIIIISWIGLIFFTLMFGLTQYNSEKELLASLKSSLKIGDNT